MPSPVPPLKPTLSPALGWLATACRPDAAAPGNPPAAWGTIIALAARHRVGSLLYAGLQRHAVAPPEDVATQLMADAQLTTAANLRGAAECRRLEKSFASADVPMLFIKGLTLSQLAYGSASRKMSRDIDLLVPPEQIVAASQLLQGLGYRLQEPTGLGELARWHRWSKESVWRHPSGLLVELHSRLTDHSALLPGLRADGPSQRVGIAPGTTLPTLTLAPLLAYLAVHGASSAWFRLKWLADLQALIASAGITELDAVHAAMRAHGAGRAADLAIVLLERAYALPLGDALARTLAKDRRVRWLAAEALRQLHAMPEPTERRGGTIGIHASQLLIGEHWTFPLSEGVRRTGEVLFRRFSAG